MIKASSTLPILHSFLAASLLISCSASDDMPVSHPEGEPHAVEISMLMGVSGGIASRNLDTWDGAQQVNDMRLYLFRCLQEKYNTKDEAFTYYVPDDIKQQGYYTVDEFNNTTPYYSADHEGKPEQHSFALNTNLESGYYYQFLAVGRDDKYVDPESRLLGEPLLKEGITTLQTAEISIAESAATIAKSSATVGKEEPLLCPEFFSGVAQDETTKDENPILVSSGPTHSFRATITATRNVAGLMIYVTNIPSIVETNTPDPDGTPTKFTPTRLSIEATSIAKQTMLKGKTAPATAQLLNNRTLGVIDLTAANGWTVDDVEHVFTRPADKEKKWQKNSYLVSNFMMPTPEEVMGKSPNAEGAETTFYLHYTDDKGHHRYDNVKKTGSTGEVRKFPIEANHLYSLGSKSSTSNDPYDLKKHYEPIMVDIAIEIEPAFEKKHEFETE